MAKQIKSRARVEERGEVFTAEREVNAMLDLVSTECLRPDSRFLEPACGNGNFINPSEGADAEWIGSQLYDMHRNTPEPTFVLCIRSEAIHPRSLDRPCFISQKHGVYSVQRIRELMFS